MRVIHLNYPYQLEKEKIERAVAAIGFFDGVHKGHQRVIKKALDEAESQGVKSAVITFFPHPSVVLSKGTKSIQYITPEAEKLAVFESLGIDIVYIIKFSHQLANLSPEQFLDEFIEGLKIVHLIAGFDFTFGRKGIANMKSIDNFSNEFTSESIEKVTLKGEKVSSTRIRNCLRTGDIEAVTELLGRQLNVVGIVVSGFKRGRKLGFPTANIEPIDPSIILPSPGVYAVRVYYKNKSYEGVASLGYNPTFEATKDKLKFEVYLLNFKGDLYGEYLTVEWYHFIRLEQKFSSLEELISQIELDVQRVKEYFQE